MIGTGVFSTREPPSLTQPPHYSRIIPAGSILKGVGSVGLSLIFWVIGYAFAGGKTSHLHILTWLTFFPAASLAVYLEFASYFPHRSGAEVAYLEKVYRVSLGA